MEICLHTLLSLLLFNISSSTDFGGGNFKSDMARDKVGSGRNLPFHIRERPQDDEGTFSNLNKGK